MRGICCLRPGLPGVSERIRVTSIVDHFLEHARIFLFEAGGAREVYATSADWMPRNFQRRVEVLFPIEDEAIKTRLAREVLGTQLEDNVKAWLMNADGSYVRKAPVGDEPLVRSQRRFLAVARELAERADQKALRDRPFVVRPVRNLPTKSEKAALVLETDKKETSSSGAVSASGRPGLPPDRS